MIESNVYEVIVRDPDDLSDGNEFKFVVRLGRNWGPIENEEVVKTWVQGWIQLDRQKLPGFSNFQARSLDHGEVIELGRGHDIGQGIRIWIKALPMGSQLHDRLIFRRFLTQLKLEAARQAPCLIFPVR